MGKNGKQRKTHTEFTPKKKEKFLGLLVATGGNVSRSAEAVNVSRQVCYDHRDANDEFKAQWKAAIETGTEDLEQEARRRAFEGFEEPVYYKGEVCGYIQKYSDNLLMFLLKGRRPDAYRDRSQIDFKGETTVYDGKDKSAKGELESILSRRLSRISPAKVDSGSNGS